MAQLKQLLNLQWKSFRRNFLKKRQTHRRYFLALFIFLPFYIISYFHFLLDTATNLSHGKTQDFETLALVILAAWTLLPLVSNNTYLPITAPRLNAFPLSTPQLFLVECWGFLLQPVSWVVVSASLSLLVPLAAAAPWLGIPAGMLFGLIGFSFALFLKNSFYEARGFKRLFPAALLGGLVFSVYSGGKKFLPSAWLAAIGGGRKETLFFLLLLLLLLFPATYAAYSVFAKRLKVGEGENFRGEAKLFWRIVSMPGKLSGLFQKEFFYFCRSWNIWLGFIVVGLYLYYLVTVPEVVPDSMFIVVLFVLAPNAGFTLNAFGMDSRGGVERFMLLPLRGWQVLLVKNLAFLAVVSMQVLVFFAGALGRVGWKLALGGIIEVSVVLLILLTWGNAFSIRYVVPVGFYRFFLVSLHLGVPFIVSFFLLHIGVFGFIDMFRADAGVVLWKWLLVLLGSVTVYVGTLFLYGRKLEVTITTLRSKLSPH